MFLFQAYWIGLNDKHSEKRFTWVDGVDLTKTNFTNWKKGEPANSFGNEDCVEVHGKELPGKWNDNHCSSLRRYICEKKGGMLEYQRRQNKGSSPSFTSNITRI